MKLPIGLELWTADEVAECLPLSHHLPDDYPGGTGALDRELWGFVEDAENPTPLGGDGSNGTVEYPCGRLSDKNDDKAVHWWSKLTEVAQAAIVAAYNAEYGNHVGP